MKPIAYTIVLFAVSLSGCGESETEKQKVALETVRLQQEQLQELDKRKDEVKELESKLKGSQDAFEQFRKEQESKLEERETNIERKEHEMRQLSDTLAAQKSELQRMATTNQAALDEAKAIQREIQNRGMIASQRHPFLENLAMKAAEHIVAEENELIDKANQATQSLFEQYAAQAREETRLERLAVQLYNQGQPADNRKSSFQRVWHVRDGEVGRAVRAAQDVGSAARELQEEMETIAEDILENGYGIAALTRSYYKVGATTYCSRLPTSFQTKIHELLLTELQNTDVLLIESQEKFERTATEIASRFIAEAKRTKSLNRQLR